MRTERDISFRGLCPGMTDEDRSKYKLPKGKDVPQAELDRYIRKVYEAEEALSKADPYQKEPLKGLTDKVNGFLQRHAGLTYEEFVRRANPYDFDENDYSVLPKRALRRRLFDHRAYLYLSALDDCEGEGANIEQLLEKIRQERVPFIKKEESEPTFNAILAACKKH